MRRPAVSIPSNIVNRCNRKNEKEFTRFLNIAYGSLRELQYQLVLSVKVNLIRPENIENCLL